MAFAETPGAAVGARLFDHAVGLLVDHVGGDATTASGWRFGPLVVVAPDDGAASSAVRAALVHRGQDPEEAGPAWDGGSLDREIAAALAGDRFGRFASSFDSRRLVTVDRIDLVAHPERQEALVHLLDATTAAWCVSVARIPPVGFSPQCASRLCGGLVVPGPRRAADPRTVAVPSMRRVIRAAARHHDVTVEDVLGPSRRRTIAAARSLAMYLARRLTGLSFHAIGRACGGRDHTTVLHGTRVCGEKIARDAAFAADVERITDELAGGDPRSATVRRRTGVGSVTLGRELASRRRDRHRMA